MPQQSSIGRRMEAAVDAYMNADYETTLIHLFPAIDKTAKIRRPKSKVGERIRGFLQDEEDLISFIATGAIIKNIQRDGKSIIEAIYEFGRCPIAHEGELDPRLKFTDEIEIRINHEWRLPKLYIFSMIIAVITAKENANEFFVTDCIATIREKQIHLNTLWGKSSFLRELLGMYKLYPRPC